MTLARLSRRVGGAAIPSYRREISQVLEAGDGYEDVYRKFDEDFKAGAVRIVEETGKPIAQVARELGVNEGTLGNWVAAARPARDGEDPPLTESERAELVRLRKGEHRAADAA
ncbi:transposase [Agromyces bauzanensis]|uniref:Transposase n=1 Tax=Agromyces bauzanensis TaxID=1308924 RepID=A0A917PMQ7_9MICO|nr:transposase [Agromyces bauzanensis]GGJ85144.1 hypothetical protein GCM10011372_24280 [Agromyces bauzanensis]